MSQHPANSDSGTHCPVPPLTMLSFYLALYNINDPTTHHWALIATEGGRDLTDGPVQMFQIVTQREGHPGEGGYMASHTRRTLLEDESAERLLCVVPLPNLDMTLPELERFMQAQPVGRKDTPLIPVPWGRWECSQWAIRAIKNLIEAGVVVPQSSGSFFTKAAASRAVWGPMLQVAGTKCAHDAVAARSAGREEGIRVASLAASGIKL